MLITGEGNGNPLQYSCLENPMDREVWQVTVHGVVKDSDGGNWVTYKLKFQTLSTSYIVPLDITSKT